MQVTHRETIRDMGELGAAVIVKGKYYKLGTAPGPTDERKLYLHIEGERGLYFCVGVCVGVCGWVRLLWMEVGGCVWTQRENRGGEALPCGCGEVQHAWWCPPSFLATLQPMHKPPC